MSFEQYELEVLGRFEKDFSKFECELPETQLKHPSSWWRVISCLQKAVRRGNVRMAIGMAVALQKADDAKLWRRMVVIAYEDIGIADVELCSLLIAIAGKAKYREKLGLLKVSAYIAARMAETVKDRSTCDLLVCDLFSDNSLIDLLADTDDLMSIVLDAGEPYPRRARASRLLLKTDRDAFVRVCERLSEDKGVEIPEEILYLAIKGANRTSDLSSTLPLAWVLSVGANPKVVYNEIPQHDSMVGNVLACAFDQHNQDGKRCLAYFNKRCTPVREFFSARPELDPLEVTGMALFEVESALLDRAWVHDNTYDITEAAERIEMKKVGLDWDEALLFRKSVVDNYEDLMKSRRRVVLGTQEW